MSFFDYSRVVTKFSSKQRSKSRWRWVQKSYPPGGYGDMPLSPRKKKMEMVMPEKVFGKSILPSFKYLSKLYNYGSWQSLVAAALQPCYSQR